jgi:hypothetical protein
MFNLRRQNKQNKQNEVNTVLKVLAEIEETARTDSLPSIGPIKGKIVKSVIMEHKPKKALEIGKRCQLFKHINYLVPSELRVAIPSIISHDCIDQFLSTMEEKISPPIYELAI